MYFLGKERPVGFGAEDDFILGGCPSFGGRLYRDPETGRLVCMRFDDLPIYVEGPNRSEERPVPPELIQRTLRVKEIEQAADVICKVAGGKMQTVDRGVRACFMPDGSSCAPEALVKGTCKEPKKSTAAVDAEPLDKTTLVVGGVILAAGLAVALWPRPRTMQPNRRRAKSRKGT